MSLFDDMNGCGIYGGGYYNTDFPGTHEYDQDLRWLVCAYKKLMPEFSNLEERVKKLEELYETIPEEIQKAVDVAMGPIYTEMNKLRQQMDEWNIEINEKFAEQNKRLEGMLSTITAMQTYVDQILPAARAYADEQDAKVKMEILNYVNGIASKQWPPVKDPTDGRMEDINTALAHMFKGLSSSITYRQLDMLGITYAQWNQIMMTYKQLNTMAFDLFNKELDKRFYMYSPFNGDWVPITTVIWDLYRLHFPGRTYDALNALNITYDELNARGVTYQDLNAGLASNARTINATAKTTKKVVRRTK